MKKNDISAACIALAAFVIAMIPCFLWDGIRNDGNHSRAMGISFILFCGLVSCFLGFVAGREIGQDGSSLSIDEVIPWKQVFTLERVCVVTDTEGKELGMNLLVSLRPGEQRLLFCRGIRADDLRIGYTYHWTGKKLVSVVFKRP